MSSIQAPATASIAPPAARLPRRARAHPLVWVIAAAVLARVALAVAAWLATGGVAVFRTDDSLGYLHLARELVERGTFSWDGRPNLVRTPGYPLFLVPGVLAGPVEVVTIALQVVVSAVLVATVYRLGRTFSGDRRAALAGAALFALDPLSASATLLVQTEILYAALIAAGLVLLTRHLESERKWELAGGIALLCAAVYVRPAGYFLPFCVAAFLAARAARRRDLRLAGRAVLAAALAVALLFPWQMRNRARTGYGGFSAISDMSVYFYNAGQVLAAREGIPFTEQLRRMGFPGGERYLAAHPEQRGWPEADFYRYMRREGTRVIRENP
ncbi:MAG TPA: glycosyltransferase family 39 protein, partial [Longimicrobium sp.]|nr:glycosyltransferase family 39 protein [Longimicrobium sp.]